MKTIAIWQNPIGRPFTIWTRNIRVFRHNNIHMLATVISQYDHDVHNKPWIGLEPYGDGDGCFISSAIARCAANPSLSRTSYYIT